MLKIKVGITIGLQHAAEPLWNNGIKQNAVFLAETLKNCPSVETVRLVNTTDILITEQLPWDLNRWPTISFEQAKDELDLLIELGAKFIIIDDTDAVQLVNYINAYFENLEV